MELEALGIRTVRGEESVIADELPDIFADIRADDYELLAPLAAKAHIAEERRKMIYWKPEIYKDASEEVWHEYFFGEDTDGYCKGEHMDLSLIVPLAEQAEKGEWKKCGLEKVKEYILKLI